MTGETIGDHMDAIIKILSQTGKSNGEVIGFFAGALKRRGIVSKTRALENLAQTEVALAFYPA